MSVFCYFTDGTTGNVNVGYSEVCELAIMEALSKIGKDADAIRFPNGRLVQRISLGCTVYWI